MDGYGIIVHKIALTDCPLIVIAKDNLFKKSSGVECRCGCEANFYPIEMLQHLTPFAFFLGGVTTVALICNDNIKGMDWNIKFGGIRVVIQIPGRVTKHTFIAK